MLTIMLTHLGCYENIPVKELCNEFCHPTEFNNCSIKDSENCYELCINDASEEECGILKNDMMSCIVSNMSNDTLICEDGYAHIDIPFSCVFKASDWYDCSQAIEINN